VHQDISEYMTSSRNIIKRFLNWIRGSVSILVYKFASNFGARIIAVSSYVKDSLVKNKFKDSKILVAYQGVDTKRRIYREKKLVFRKEFDISEDDILVGAIGRLHSIKGFSYFIQAAREVVKKMPQMKFVLIGDGEEKNDLESMINELKLSKNFILAGHRENILELLPEMDLFVSSSLTEGLGIAVLEAMLASKPVIATRVGAIPELIENEKTGLLVSAKDSYALSEKILFLANNKEKARELGKNAYEKVMNNFTLDKQVDETFNLYSQILKN